MRKKVKRKFTAKFDDGLIKKLDSYEIADDGTCLLEFEVEIEVEETMEKVKIPDSVLIKPQKKEITSNSNIKTVSQDFIVVDVQNLSLSDEFMQYQVQTTYEQSFKGNLINVIKQNGPNFCKPLFDPVISGSQGLTFTQDMDPAVGMSFTQWSEIAKTFKSSKNSRIGSRDEYIAFLGFLIKKMVESGIPIEVAWNSVCNDSSNIGVYATDLSFQNVLRKTGSKEICGFYDLANTQKVLLSDLSFTANFFWKAGGTYHDDGKTKPLATFEFCTDPNEPLAEAVGWIIWNT